MNKNHPQPTWQDIARNWLQIREGDLDNLLPNVLTGLIALIVVPGAVVALVKWLIEGMK